VFSIEGKWIFNNLFSQRINYGIATIDQLFVSVIEYIEFTNIPIDSDQSNKYMTKKGKTRILLSDNTVDIFDCYYLDMTTVIVLKILAQSEINISLFVFKHNDNQYYYSYAISSDIQYGIIKGTSPEDGVFMNFIGIMERDY
jgi:hypothetical protein